MFGSFIYRGRESGKEITSPFSILAKVKDGKITYVQSLEDTFARREGSAAQRFGEGLGGAHDVMLLGLTRRLRSCGTSIAGRRGRWPS